MEPLRLGLLLGPKPTMVTADQVCVEGGKVRWGRSRTSRDKVYEDVRVGGAGGENLLAGL